MPKTYKKSSSGRKTEVLPVTKRQKVNASHEEPPDANTATGPVAHGQDVPQLPTASQRMVTEEALLAHALSVNDSLFT
eukprot:946536-Karenia_brevis.AAC.1